MHLQLEKPYGEIFRVLKPGGKFVSYEWVTLPDFDPNNEKHVETIQQINLRNGLPVGCRPPYFARAATCYCVAAWAAAQR